MQLFSKVSKIHTCSYSCIHMQVDTPRLQVQVATHRPLTWVLDCALTVNSRPVLMRGLSIALVKSVTDMPNSLQIF